MRFRTFIAFHARLAEFREMSTSKTSETNSAFTNKFGPFVERELRKAEAFFDLVIVFLTIYANIVVDSFIGSFFGHGDESLL